MTWGRRHERQRDQLLVPRGTPDLVSFVWHGNPDVDEPGAGFGAGVPNTIWRNFMIPATRGQPADAPRVRDPADAPGRFIDPVKGRTDQPARRHLRRPGRRTRSWCRCHNPRLRLRLHRFHRVPGRPRPRSLRRSPAIPAAVAAATAVAPCRVPNAAFVSLEGGAGFGDARHVPLELQTRDTTIDRLRHRRDTLPERAARIRAHRAEHGRHAARRGDGPARRSGARGTASTTRHRSRTRRRKSSGACTRARSSPRRAPSAPSGRGTASASPARSRGPRARGHGAPRSRSNP